MVEHTNQRVTHNGEVTMAKITIELDGWVHVHTYRESHGDHVTDIYQKKTTHSYMNPSVLEHTRYRNPNTPDAVTMHTKGDGMFRDYLLAEAINQDTIDNSSDWLMIQDKISPCYTAGYRTWYHKPDQCIYHITQVAGHGRWGEKRDAGDEEIAKYEGS